MLGRGREGGWGGGGGWGGALHGSLRQLELKEISDRIAVPNLAKYWSIQIINIGSECQVYGGEGEGASPLHGSLSTPESRLIYFVKNENLVQQKKNKRLRLFSRLVLVYEIGDNS